MRFIVVLVAWTGLVAPSWAEEAKPTLEQCTCVFDEKAAPGTQRARASNATLCVQTIDRSPNQRWCEITIACLRRNVGPDCRASSSPKQALLPLYDFHRTQVLEAGGSPIPAAFAAQAGANGQAIARLSAEAGKALDDCVRAYLDRGEDKAQTDKQVSCHYNRATRWLDIAFELEAQIVKFSFGPRE
jgi:hypothetical protein